MSRVSSRWLGFAVGLFVSAALLTASYTFLPFSGRETLETLIGLGLLSLAVAAWVECAYLKARPPK